MTRVYFAINRAADPTKPNGFGSGIVADDPNAMLYAVCDVPSSNTGQIGAISDRTMGRFSDAATGAIVGSGKNLLRLRRAAVARQMCYADRPWVT